MPDYRLLSSGVDSSSDVQLSTHTISPAAQPLLHTHTPSVPPPLTTYCQNKQHQPCQHRDLSLRARDIHLVDTHNINLYTHTHLAIRDVQNHTQQGEKDQWGIVVTKKHAYTCLLCLCLAHTHSTPDRDTDCYWQAGGQVISWQPLSPCLLIQTVRGRRCWHLRPVCMGSSHIWPLTQPDQSR